MRHPALCFLFFCWLPHISGEPYQKAYQGRDKVSITPTPSKSAQKQDIIKLVDKYGRNVRLRLFIDNFQLVVTSSTKRFTLEEELTDDWNDTSYGAVLRVQRLHEMVDRQLELWKTRFRMLDQVNASRALGEVSVKRVPYRSVKLEFKARRGVEGRKVKGGSQRQDQSRFRVAQRQVAQELASGDVLHDCIGDVDEGCSGDTVRNDDSAVIWFLLSCIIAQVLTMLSVFGVWSPRRVLSWLGDLLLYFSYGLGLMALRAILAPFSWILQTFRRKQVVQYTSHSGYAPFLADDSSCGAVSYLYLPEDPASTSSAFSSFSSYTSELPFLRRPESDRSIYNPKHFDLIRTLGKGHFGKVVQLQHRKTGEMVAVKIMMRRKSISEGLRVDLNASLLNRASHGRMDSDDDDGGTIDLTTVQGEIRAMLRVQNSEYAEWSPRVLGTYFNQNNYFIVMPYYERGDIIDCMKRGGGCVSRGLAKFYIAELICAIHFLHTLRVVHRDIKPENILLSVNGHIVVADLGVAHVFRESSSSLDNFDRPIITSFQFPSTDSAVWLDDEDFAKWEEGEKKGGDDFPFLNPSTDNPHVITGEHGTPMYAAPEVFSGGKYSYGVDYYSMGMVYHQMITGYLPLADGGPIAGSEHDLNGERRWILDLGRHHLHLQVLSVKERSFLEKVLREDPFERPSVLKMKADPLFADIDWERIGRREEIVPHALRIRRRGSLQISIARCESENGHSNSSSTCSVDSNIG